VGNFNDVGSVLVYIHGKEGSMPSIISTDDGELIKLLAKFLPMYGYRLEVRKVKVEPSGPEHQ
jgi:hypothetical protein